MMARESRLVLLRTSIRSRGPKTVYSAFLYYAEFRRYSPGFAAHKFKAIFGTWPRYQDRGPAIEVMQDEVTEWLSMQKR